MHRYAHVDWKYLPVAIPMIIAFIPALVLSYLFANVFLKALNIVGGIGLVLLFGILPTIIFYKNTSTKFGVFISGVFFVAFSITLIITILQTFGILHIHPYIS